MTQKHRHKVTSDTKMDIYFPFTAVDADASVLFYCCCCMLQEHKSNRKKTFTP